MRIPVQASVANIERALREAAAAPKNEPFILPSNLRHFGCGGEAALNQLLVTWAQPRPPVTLKTYVETPEQIRELVRRLPGLTGALCAGVIMGGGKAGDLTHQVRDAALARLTTLLSAKPKAAYRGSSVEIICADHLGRNAPYLLYKTDSGQAPQLRPRHSFTLLASWLLRQTVPEAYQNRIAPQMPDALGGMIFELFKNTEEHGQSDAFGNILSMSIRAIKTVHHAIKPETLAQIVADYPPLAHYCRSLEPAEDAAQTHLFELSILDSGPGFAVSRAGKTLVELSSEEEEAAVRDCFTTFSAKGGSRFGQGLPHVLRVLRQERGFLRLRTGRLSIHADFSDTNEGEGPEALQVFRPEGGVLAPVAGSLLTVLLPLRRGW
ncbi:TPA: hypothetical protein I8220_004511 [Aeromonas hydrophila]|nr:hypothetical protein [Aeromonas hydrophila]HAT2497575.1 hypothetical protein [Aeromonas hydrophila]HAT2512032.1 hypothetical protein [Aeromonas hydrophila]HAT2532524.1 hypothetical protein [Aeromonas hydrophila]